MNKEDFKAQMNVNNQKVDVMIINNKEYMSDDMTLYIEYKDGSTYYLGGSFDDGKFKKTGIKNVIIRDNKDTYRTVDVQDWITNDESLEGTLGY